MGGNMHTCGIVRTVSQSRHKRHVILGPLRNRHQDGIRIARESLKAVLLKNKSERKEKEPGKYFKSMT